MSGDPKPLTQEEKLDKAMADLVAKCVLGQLNASQLPPTSHEALESQRAGLQAEKYRTAALVDVLWGVECVWLDGETYLLYTSKETVAQECKEYFGWIVNEDKTPSYKYSKSFYDSRNMRDRDWRRWINPPGQEHAVFMDGWLEWERWDFWDCCTIQVARKPIPLLTALTCRHSQYIVWWAMELRRPFAKDNKDKPLDLEGTLLPKKYAADLLKPMDHEQAPLPDKIKAWIRNSAKNGPEDSRFDSAHDWDKLPL